MNAMNELGIRISTFRKSMGLSQKEMAEKLFVSPSTISKWENGDATPDIHRIKEIAEFFQISVTELIGEKISFTEENSQNKSKQTVVGSDNKEDSKQNEINCSHVQWKQSKNKDLDSESSQEKKWRNLFIVLTLITVASVAIWILSSNQSIIGNSLKFEIVDEFLDESSKQWGYDSIYNVVVEFDGVLNSDAQITYGEYLRKKYR